MKTFTAPRVTQCRTGASGWQRMEGTVMTKEMHWSFNEALKTRAKGQGRRSGGITKRQAQLAELI